MMTVYRTLNKRAAATLKKERAEAIERRLNRAKADVLNRWYPVG